MAERSQFRLLAERRFGSFFGVQFLGAAMAFSAAGIALSRLIPKAPAADPELKINWNPVTETWRNLRFTRRNRTVFLSILGIFGIGVGSLLCERLSGHKVEIGLVPFGSIGLTVFGIDLWLASAGHIAHGPVALGEFVRDSGHWRLLTDLLLIGLFGGFYSVPLYALVQARSEPSHRSRIIAGNNILNAVFMVGAAALAIGLLQAGVTIPQLILVTALLNAAVAIYIYTLVPEFLMRFIIWMLIHSVYRLKKAGLENIPDEGAAMTRPWRLRPFASIGLAVGASLAASAATPEVLQAGVLGLRADWR